MSFRSIYRYFSAVKSLIQIEKNGLLQCIICIMEHAQNNIFDNENSIFE